MTDVSCISRIW